MGSIESHFSEQFDAIFGVPPVASECGQPVAQDAPDTDQDDGQAEAPVSIIEHFRIVWKQAIGCIDESAAALNRGYCCDEDLMERLGRTGFNLVNLDVNEYEVQKQKDALANSMLNSMVFLAQEHFSTAGLTLSINGDDVRRRFQNDYHRIEAKDFDPGAVWEYFESEYGGDAGVQLALGQLATEFHRAFGLGREEEVKIVGGRVVLKVSVYIDSFDKKWSNTNRLSYSSVDWLSAAIKHMAEVASWADRDQLVVDLTRMVRHFGDRCYHVQSREKFELGAEKEVQLVTFNERFEFRLSKAFADQVQVFIGTYLPQDRAQ